MAKHDVIVTLTGESTGIQKAANSGSEALRGLSSAIQTVVERTQSSSTAVNNYQDGLGKFTSATTHAKAAVAQINQEEAKRIAIENELIATLTKEEVAVLRLNGILRQQVAVVNTVTSATAKFGAVTAEASASTSVWVGSIQRFRDATGGIIPVLTAAKAAVAQLSMEKARAIEIELMLINALSAEDVALLRNAGVMTSLTGVAQQNTAATVQNAQAHQTSANSMGAASFALTSLGQTFADAGQFGMGAAQGIRAVTNNVQQFAFAFIFLRIQLGTTALAMKELWVAISGPLGILFAFQMVTGAFEGYSNWSQRADKRNREQRGGVDDLAKAYKDLVKVIPNENAPLPKLVLESDLEAQIAGLKTRLESEVKDLALSSEQLPPPEIITGFGAQMRSLDPSLSAAKKRIADLTLEIKNLTDQLPASTKEAEGFLSFITTVKEENAKASQTVVDLRGKIKDLSLELADAGKHGELEKRLKDLQDLQASGWNAGMGGSSTSAIEALNADYEEFTKALVGFNSELSVSRSEYAKLVAAHKVESTLEEERQKAAKRWAKQDKIEGDIILKRIARTIAEMERLNRESEKFAKLGTLRSPLDGLPGTATSIGRARDIIDGGVVTDDGRLRSEALADMQIGSEMLRQLPEDATIAAQHAADGIASVSQTFGESVQGWLTTNNEAIQKNAQMLGSSLGSAGQAFSQLAQMGGEANESLFNTGKAFAIGSAIVNTAAAITKALAEGGPFLGPAMAAAMAASGAAQIAVIARTKFNGSGSGGASTPSFSAATGTSAQSNIGFRASAFTPASSLGSPMSLGAMGTQNITGTFYASGRDLVAVVGAEASSQQAMGIKNPLRISNN